VFKLRHSPTVLAILLACGGLAACGGGSSNAIPPDAVAVVGDTPISKATLNHWMKTIVGGDFFERLGKRAPLNLVSEPPNYAACLPGAKELTEASGRKPPFTTPELEQKCRQLYEAIKEQTMTFLISVQWRINEAAEEGITVSDAEISKYANEANASEFPKPGEFAKYLADREWAPSDQLYQFKRNLLSTKLAAHIKAGDTAQAHIAYINFIKKNITKRTAETNCRRGYLVFQCRQFKAPPAGLPAPIVILEELYEKG
jgi:hypothetical protein